MNIKRRDINMMGVRSPKDILGIFLIIRGLIIFIHRIKYGFGFTLLFRKPWWNEGSTRKGIYEKSFAENAILSIQQQKSSINFLFYLHILVTYISNNIIFYEFGITHVGFGTYKMHYLVELNKLYSLAIMLNDFLGWMLSLKSSLTYKWIIAPVKVSRSRIMFDVCLCVSSNFRGDVFKDLVLLENEFFKRFSFVLKELNKKVDKRISKSYNVDLLRYIANRGTGFIFDDCYTSCDDLHDELQRRLVDFFLKYGQNILIQDYNIFRQYESY